MNGLKLVRLQHNNTSVLYFHYFTTKSVMVDLRKNYNNKSQHSLRDEMREVAMFFFFFFLNLIVPVKRVIKENTLLIKID